MSHINKKYLRGLPVSKEDVTLPFNFIKQILKDANALAKGIRHPALPSQ